PESVSHAIAAVTQTDRANLLTSMLDAVDAEARVFVVDRDAGVRAAIGLAQLETAALEAGPGVRQPVRCHRRRVARAGHRRRRIDRQRLLLDEHEQLPAADVE